MKALLAGVASLVFAAPLVAEEATSQAGKPPVSGAADTVGTLVSLGLGLLAVVALIYGCAWLVRRMSGMTGMNNQAMKVVSVMALGTRERIALVEVGGQQILLGITPSSIRTLHVFDEPVVEAGKPVSGDFAKRLQGMIGKSWNSSTKD